MLGRRVLLSAAPQRIISLVPSQTEFLYELGLAGRIAGQTVFCVHPSDYFEKAVKVGGTKKVRYEAIHSLKPDLIICNKEENTEEIVNTLAADYPVWVSDIKTLEDAYHMMLALGKLLDKEEKALSIVEAAKQQFELAEPGQTYSCLYLIWRNPFMAAGSDTFINSMLKQAGFINLAPEYSRYPEISLEDMVALAPQLVLLSSEPYPFNEQHIQELASKLPKSRIMLADGEFFSWYGSRLVNSQNYFNQLHERLRDQIWQS